jgi:GntP family gluconate:H+ symporter
LARGFDARKVSVLVGASLAPAAAILLIIGAGGGFKQLLIDSGIGDSIAKAAEQANISALLLAWIVAVLIRLATLVLAIGADSLFFSHLNDAGFWLVKEYFGMTVADTIKTWSVMETIISVVGLASLCSS